MNLDTIAKTKSLTELETAKKIMVKNGVRPYIEKKGEFYLIRVATARTFAQAVKQKNAFDEMYGKI